jgi:ABC-type multidrug transport system fused ATPase/permease subunit
MGLQCIRGTSFCPVSVTGSRYQISEYLEVFFQIFFCTFNFLQLGSNYNAIKSAIVSSREIYNFIEKNEIIKERKEMMKPKNLGKVCFKNVIFSYPLNRSKRILNKINIEFLEYKFNAVVGTTGCGKSTIIQLLLKQYERESGSITVGDGIDLNDVSTSYWLDKIGIVTQ